MTNTTDITVSLPLTFDGRTLPGTVTLAVDFDALTADLADGDAIESTLRRRVEGAELVATTGDPAIDARLVDGDYGDNLPTIEAELIGAIADELGEIAGNARDQRDQWAARGRAL